MIITKEIGTDDLAKVYVGEIRGKPIEFAESLQPPFKREEKWVLIVSCLLGCPVRCLMCDAGRNFYGCLKKEDIFEQIDHMVYKRFPDGDIPVKKFKIQFTRMGEPAYNTAVLDVLRELPQRYTAPGLIPSVSTVGPSNSMKFFRKLRDIKNELYNNGRFQMQFSIHTTDSEKRDQLIPIEKMSFEEIADYGKDFFHPGDRKITLNFIVMDEYPIDPAIIAKHFDPSIFVIKLTPLNPTDNAQRNQLSTKLDPDDERSVEKLVQALKSHEFDTIVSIGELKENLIGSNCGQYISAMAHEKEGVIPLNREEANPNRLAATFF